MAGGSADPRMWLEILCTEVLTELEDEEVNPKRPYARIEKYGEIHFGALTCLGPIPTLHCLDRTSVLSTIQHFPMPLEEATEIRARWHAALRSLANEGSRDALDTFMARHENGTDIVSSFFIPKAMAGHGLVIDPRIPLAFGKPYEDAVGPVGRRDSASSIMTPMDFVNNILPDDGFAKETLAIWKSFVSTSSIQPTREYAPPAPEKEKGFRNLIYTFLETGRSHIRMGHFHDAIVTVGRACSMAVHHHFAPAAEKTGREDYGAFLYRHRDEIAAEFGKAIYIDIMEIRSRRNIAEHQPEKPADAALANMVLRRGENVLSAIFKK